MPMEAFVDRIFEFMTYLGISQNKFEEACGLTHSNLRTMKQGPTAAYLMKIITAYPELSLDWLFRGTGDMFIGKTPTPSPSVSIGTIQTVNIGNWNELVELLKARV